MNAIRQGAGAGARQGLELLLVLTTTVALGGCGIFERNSDFDRVAEERPLEVPPDLDRPRQSTVMSVPGESSGGAAGTRDDGRTLMVADTVDSTYRRMGLALERSTLEITSRTESAHEIVVDYIDDDAKEQRPGLFSRWILRRKGPEDLSGRYRLVVNPESGGSAITVLTESGSPAPVRVARDILAVVEGRLG